MKTFSRLKLTLATVLAMCLLAQFAQADAVLRDMRGNITTFEDSQTPGQWTVVMIWASDCHVCNEESGQYSAFHDKHVGKDANIIGMSIDGWSGREDAQAFIERNWVIFPNLIGDLEVVANWYAEQTGESFRATPTFLVFGPQGELKAAQAGAVPPDVVESFMASNG